MRPPGRMFFYICEMKYARMGYARMKVGENKIQEVEKTKIPSHQMNDSWGLNLLKSRG